MNPDLPEPERWCDRPARGTSAESAIGATLRRVRQATEPSDAALARARRRTRTPARSRAAHRVWRLALAAVLVMATGGVVGAARIIWRRLETTGPERAPAGERAPGALPARPHRRHGLRAAAESGEPALPQPASAADPGALPGPAGPTAAAPPAPLEVVPPPSGTPPAPRAPGSTSVAAGEVAGLGRVAAARPGAPPGEAAALAEAFRELRSGGDAASALRSLEQYDRRFPAGVLRSEARIARAEALIALGRRAEALPLLEGLEGERGALTRNVRITRGELLAEGGHCARAVRDFDALLASPERDEVGGRALYGRASCHLNAGEVAPARRDLERYLLLYPDGDLAAAARGVLDRLK